jgi:hypothetical protein
LRAWIDIQLERFNWLSGNFAAIRSRRRNSDNENASYEVLANANAKLMTTLDAVADRSCDKRCNSLCCFFDPSRLTVQLDLKSVGRIREYLKGTGRRFEDYVRKCWYDRLPKELLDCLQESEFVFVEDGIKKVYEVNTKEGGLNEYESGNLPLIWDGRRMWVDYRSAPCAFLADDRRCSLYIAGIRPTCCSNFQCSTNLSLKVAKQLGYLKDEDTSDLDFSKVKIFGDCVFAAFEKLVEHEKEYHTAFMSLGSAYIDGADITRELSRFKDAEVRYLTKRRALFKNAINPSFSDYLRRLFS